MNQFGLLGRYLPNFGKIVGQMQHDLFHVYTVDQHTLQVLRNLRRFSPTSSPRVSAVQRADQ
jgi:[protein-PII] uridylyltransferase